MIIKDIVRKRQTDPHSIRFASSIQYSRLDKHKWRLAQRNGFDQSIEYSRKPDLEKLVGERVIHSFARGVTAIETAVWEMDAVSRLSICRDPVLHAVLSYNSAHDENPTFEQIEADVETFLRARGYIDAKRLRGGETEHVLKERECAEVNQHVAFVHGDTDHLHVHVIANRVSRTGYAANNDKNYLTNERTAAKIAGERGWSIVVGHNNFDLVKAQAIEMGASAKEIKALADKNYPSLKHLKLKNPIRPLDAERQHSQSGRQREFSDDYSSLVQSSYGGSTSMQEFREQCLKGGILVKFRVKSAKNGQEFPTLAFTDLEDKTGQSGTKLGVSAKDIIEKFGPWRQEWLLPITMRPPDEPELPSFVTIEEIAQQTQHAHEQILRTPPKADKQVRADETIHEATERIVSTLVRKTQHPAPKIDLKDNAFTQHAGKHNGSENLWEKLRLLRQVREKRMAKVIGSVHAQKTQHALDSALRELSRERIRISLLWSVTPVEGDNRKRLLRRFLALDAKADYATFTKKFKDNEVYELKLQGQTNRLTLNFELNAKLAAARLRALIDRQFHGKEFAKNQYEKRESKIRSDIKKEYAAAAALIIKQPLPTFQQWLLDQHKTHAVLAAIECERERPKAPIQKHQLKTPPLEKTSQITASAKYLARMKTAQEIFDDVQALRPDHRDIPVNNLLQQTKTVNTSTKSVSDNFEINNNPQLSHTETPRQGDVIEPAKKEIKTSRKNANVKCNRNKSVGREI